MNKRTSVSSEIEALVGEVREGDGIDPREEAKRKLRRVKNLLPGEEFHQQERLASQIQQAVDFALQAASTPILNALTVHDVIPQNAALVVVVVPRDPTVAVDLSESAAAVKQAAAMLRCEVAAAITRKETPNLRFVVLPAGSEQVPYDASK